MSRSGFFTMRMTSGERDALERVARAAGVTASTAIKEALGLGASPEAEPAAPRLRRVVVERLDSGGWKLLRERDGGGETFYVRSLCEAFATVLVAYLPCGAARAWSARKVAA